MAGIVCPDTVTVQPWIVPMLTGDGKRIKCRSPGTVTVPAVGALLELFKLKERTTII